MAKQYRVDTSEGMAEYIKSMNEEQLAKDKYYQNWQKWLSVPAKGGYGTSRPFRGDITPVALNTDQVSRPSATDAAKYKNAIKMYGKREDFYKN